MKSKVVIQVKNVIRVPKEAKFKNLRLDIFLISAFRKKIFEKRSHLSQYPISELVKRFLSTKGTLWVFRHFLVSFS